MDGHVTFFPASDAAALLDGGVSLFGENRDQEASAKARELAAYCAQREVQPPHWAFIGQLQTNKAKSVVKYASSVHSVDRPLPGGCAGEGVRKPALPL